MEKYRQFADGGTGVNPFVPPWSNHRSSLPVRLLKCLFFLPVALLRVSLFTVALIWLALAQFLCSIIPIGLVRYPCWRLLSSVGCRLALSSLGVLCTDEAVGDYRRLKLAPPKTKGARIFDHSHGTLILANQQGFTDVLYLCAKVCPTFVFPASNGCPVEFSLLGALSRAASRRSAPPPLQTKKLADICARAKASWGGPVVVFAEGARTNGSCVISWKQSTFAEMDNVTKPVGAAVVTLEYSKTGAYTPHHVVGTAFRHVFWLCFQPLHTMKCTWLPSSFVEPAVQGKPLAEQVAQLRTLMARMIQGCVEIDIPAAKHIEFMAYWDASQRKGYTRPKKA